MNLKLKRIIKYGAIIILALAPLAIYIWQFRNNSLSGDPNDWASFGSYVGGVYSVIVALLVVYLARELSKKDEVVSRRKRAVEVLYKQIIKVKSERVDERSVQRIYNLLDENRLYIPDTLFNEVKNLADYFLEVKAGRAIDYQKESSIKDHLRSIYNA